LAKFCEGTVETPGLPVLLGTSTELFAGSELLAGLRSMALISSISAIGVTPAMGSLENSPIRKASAPASLPLK
jgi:hypothetical protein